MAALTAGLVAGLGAAPGAAEPAGPTAPPTAPPAGADCPADPALAYICGPERPEDLLVLPAAAGAPDRWVITSGFAPGSGLKLIAAASRRWHRWYTGAAGQIAFDAAAYPQCPAPLDPALFNARGLSLSAAGPGRWRLLVVNHGGREAVEVFDVLEAGAGAAGAETAPRLVWHGCRPLPAGQVGNAVASFADGTLLVTVLTRPGTTIADFMRGRATGAVWAWRPGADRWRELPGTRLPGNNGLETDPDQRRFYVIAFGWHAVAVFDRTRPGGPVARIEAPDFMPDNIHWSRGRLLLAGMRRDEPACGGLRQIAGDRADPMLCHRGWVVGALDLAAGRVATVAYGGPQPGFNGLSSAAWVGAELWLGSYQASRLAIVRQEGTAP